MIIVPVQEEKPRDCPVEDERDSPRAQDKEGRGRFSVVNPLLEDEYPRSNQDQVNDDQNDRRFKYSDGFQLNRIHGPPHALV